MGVYAALAVVVAVLGIASPAHADDIDVRAKQLARSSDYKLRLSAALWLAKKDDSRAIKALARALHKDDESTIRQVAAKALGNLVGPGSSRRDRRRAVKALQRAIRSDRDERVRNDASKALERVEAISQSSGKSSGSQIYVHIARPSLGKHDVPSNLRNDLESALQGVVRHQAPSFMVSWPTGRAPSKAELRRKKTRAYQVLVKLGKLNVRRKGGQSVIECSVSIQVNPWEGRGSKERWSANQTASASGSGRVTGSNNSRGIDNAKLDCVLAVAEQIAAKQVIPFVKKLSGS